MWNITEKRSLWLRRHQKAQSAVRRLGRMRFSVSPNSNRDLRTLAQPAPQAGGWLLERICPVEPLSIVPRSLAGGCPAHPGRRNVTERRILRRRPHGKAHFGAGHSRKSALCVGDAMERRTLFVGPHAKAHSACGQPPRVRLSVRVCSQSALFRRMRLFSPGQMSRCLTQKRTLRRRSHGKAHSGSPPYLLWPDVSRKDALWRGVCRSHRLLHLTLMERQHQDTDILNLRHSLHSLDARKDTPYLSEIVEIVEFHIIRGAAEPVACWRGVAAGSHIYPSHRCLLASVLRSLRPLAPR